MEYPVLNQGVEPLTQGTPRFVVMSRRDVRGNEQRSEAIITPISTVDRVGVYRQERSKRLTRAPKVPMLSSFRVGANEAQCVCRVVSEVKYFRIGSGGTGTLDDIVRAIRGERDKALLGRLQEDCVSGLMQLTALLDSAAAEFMMPGEVSESSLSM